MQPLSLTLALDTSGTFLALALLSTGASTTSDHESSGADAQRTVQLEAIEEAGRAHAEKLPSALEALLAKGGLSLPNVRRIVVGLGPGSYTGLRVGAAYALGLGRALGAPVYGVPTLAGMAHSKRIMGAAGPLAICTDARHGRVYGAVYAEDEVLCPPARLPQEEFETLAQSHSAALIADPPPSALGLALLAERESLEPAPPLEISYL